MPVFDILFTNKTSPGSGWQLKSAQADRKIHPAGAIILTLLDLRNEELSKKWEVKNSGTPVRGQNWTFTLFNSCSTWSSK